MPRRRPSSSTGLSPRTLSPCDSPLESPSSPDQAEERRSSGLRTIAANAPVSMQSPPSSASTPSSNARSQNIRPNSPVVRAISPRLLHEEDHRVEGLDREIWLHRRYEDMVWRWPGIFLPRLRSHSAFSETEGEYRKRLQYSLEIFLDPIFAQHRAAVVLFWGAPQDHPLPPVSAMGLWEAVSYEYQWRYFLLHSMGMWLASPPYNDVMEPAPSPVDFGARVRDLSDSGAFTGARGCLWFLE